MSGEQTLRALVIKQANGFSYEDRAFHLVDSQSFRAFCLIGFAERTPSKSTLQRNLKRVRAETLERVNGMGASWRYRPRRFRLWYGPAVNVSPLVSSDEGILSKLYRLVVDQRTGSGWRIPALDGLRGIAAMMVLVAHTRHASVGDGDSLIWAPIERGGAGGVVLFFALSGFLLYVPWHRSHVEASGTPKLKTYALRRCLRIMPAYYASVIVLAVLRVAFGGRDPLGAPATVLHFIFLPTLMMPLQTVYWTLQVEEFFYWLLPALHRLVRAIGSVKVLVLTCVVSLLWGAAGMYFLEPTHRGLGLWLEQTPFFLPAFALGIFTAVRWADDKHAPNGRSLVLLGTLTDVAFTPLAALIASWTDHVVTPLTELLIAPAASAVVLGVARGGARFLEHPVLRFLGGISFSVYLWHLVVIRIVPVPSAIVDAFGPRVLYTTAITVPVALLSYLCVERPFLKLRP